MDIAQIAHRTVLNGSGPRYRQLGDALARAIASGELAPGERLPAERDLAVNLGMSRATVVNAYRDLASRGLIRGQVGRGTFVCAPPEADDTPFAWRGKIARAAERGLDPALLTLVRETAADTVSFAPGLTALDRFPREHVRIVTDDVLRRSTSAALGFGPTEGVASLREAIAARHNVRPEQVLILTGSQQGLDLLARCLIDPGDAVVLERPGYLGAIHTFRAAGAHLVDWDSARADMEELEDLLIRHRPKLIYVNPTFHNPTGRVMPVGTRSDLLDMAARYRIPVIEDDPYRDLFFQSAPPRSLREIDQKRIVIQIGTFSKSLAPGLRVAWLIAPEAIVGQLTLVKGRVDVFSPVLTQLVVAGLIAGGRFDEHLTGLRAEHARRHAAMLASFDRWLPPGAFTVHPVTGGFYLWGALGQGLDAGDVLARAEAAGVTFVDGSHFFVDGSGKRFARFCFTGVPPERIDVGVRRLAGVITGASTAARHQVLV